MSLVKKFLFGKKISSPLIRLLALLIILLFVSSFFYYVIEIDGESMSPTLREGEVLFVDERAYEDKEPQRYDVVVFKLNEEKEEIVIKRIIGLPTETVLIKSGEILIDERKIKIIHGNGPVGKMMAGPYTILKNCYFVIGDNRSDSFFGIISKKDIIGKVIF